MQSKRREEMKDSKIVELAKLAKREKKAEDALKKAEDALKKARNVLYKCFLKEIRKTSSKDELKKVIDAIPLDFFQDSNSPKKLLAVAEIQDIFGRRRRNLRGINDVFERIKNILVSKKLFDIPEDRDIYRLIYIMYLGEYRDGGGSRIGRLRRDTIELYFVVESILRGDNCIYAPPTKYRKSPGKLCLVCPTGPLDNFIKRIK
ncbi:MAG TPA: hypothetical protein ENL05_00230 [Candidatus Moranbacteria bacterium]|nr:hypothetical protein [Candidatus Moranbacteria bacterium]